MRSIVFGVALFALISNQAVASKQKTFSRDNKNNIGIAQSYSLPDLLHSLRDLHLVYRHPSQRFDKLVAFGDFLNKANEALKTAGQDENAKRSIDVHLWDNVFTPMSSFLKSVRKKYPQTLDPVGKGDGEADSMPSDVLPEPVKDYLQILGFRNTLSRMRAAVKRSGISLPEALFDKMERLNENLHTLTMLPPVNETQAEAINKAFPTLKEKWNGLEKHLAKFHEWAKEGNTNRAFDEGIKQLSKDLSWYQDSFHRLALDRLGSEWSELILSALYVEVERAVNDVLQLRTALEQVKAGREVEKAKSENSIVQHVYLPPKTVDEKTEKAIEQLASISYIWYSKSRSPVFEWWKTLWRQVPDMYGENHVYRREDIEQFVNETLARLPSTVMLENALIKRGRTRN